MSPIDSTFRSLWSLLCRFVPGIVFIVAGTSKVVYPASIREALNWLGAPGLSHQWLAIALGCYEGVLGIWLLSRWRAEAGRIVATVSLVGFLILLGFMRASATPPECGCFALVKLFRSNNSELMVGIGRNFWLLTLLWGDAGRERLPIGHAAVTTP